MKIIATAFIIMTSATFANAGLVQGHETQKIGNLKITKSAAKPGYWVSSFTAEPATPTFPPHKEEGCVDQKYLSDMMKPPKEMGSCDIQILEDSENRARATQCDGTIKMEMHKLAEGRYMVTTTLPDKTQLIHNFQRMGNCKAPK